MSVVPVIRCVCLLLNKYKNKAIQRRGVEANGAMALQPGEAPGSVCLQTAKNIKETCLQQVK